MKIQPTRHKYELSLYFIPSFVPLSLLFTRCLFSDVSLSLFLCLFSYLSSSLSTSDPMFFSFLLNLICIAVSSLFLSSKCLYRRLAISLSSVLVFCACLFSHFFFIFVSTNFSFLLVSILFSHSTSLILIFFSFCRTKLHITERLPTLLLFYLSYKYFPLANLFNRRVVHEWCQAWYEYVM